MHIAKIFFREKRILTFSITINIISIWKTMETLRLVLAWNLQTGITCKKIPL